MKSGPVRAEHLRGIAIIGRGSLIWRPKGLPLRDGTWHEGGPVLPIEFSRVSGHRHLTLVIDLADGISLPTRFAISSRQTVQQAVRDLQRRERTATTWIGWVNTESSSTTDHPAADAIRVWASGRGLDGAVWAALPPNFLERLHIPFTVADAQQHLENLDERRAGYARLYIGCAPPEIETKLRQALRKSGWLAK